MNSQPAVVVIGPQFSGKTNLIFHLQSPSFHTRAPIGKAFHLRNLKGLRSSAGDPIETDYSCHCVETTTKKLPIVMINTPGIPNLLNNADAAIFCVAADISFHRKNLLDFLCILKITNIKQVIVLVNKMDMKGVLFLEANNRSEKVFDEWQQEKFEAIQAEMQSFFQKHIPSLSVCYIPTATFHAHNIFNLYEKCDWYKGQTVTEALEELKIPQPKWVERPFRLSIFQVLKISGVGVCMTGKIQSGKVKVGDQVKTAPIDFDCNVKSIQVSHQNTEEAVQGQFISLHLTNVTQKQLKRGFLIGKTNDDAPSRVSSFRAKVLILCPRGKMTVGCNLTVDCHTLTFGSRISLIENCIDTRTKKEISGLKDLKEMKPFHEATVEFVPLKPVAVETWSEYETLSKFIIREGKNIIGVGKILNIAKHLPKKS